MTESLRKRIITEVIVVVLFLGVLFYLPPKATVVVLTALVLAGAWEWSAFLRTNSVPVRAAYVVLVGLLLPCVWFATVTPDGLHAVLLAALVWWFVALAWIIFAPHRVTLVSAGLAGLL